MFNTLCLSSGGINGFSFIGAILYLSKMDYIDLNDIKNYYGTSIGSILCFLLVIGYTPSEIINILYDSNFNLSTEIDIDNLISNYGLDNFNKIIDILINYLEKKLNVKDITFNELFIRTNKNLVVNTTNFTKHCEEILSYDLTPDLSVILAIRMSSSIPFIFEPILYNNCYYMDGGVSNQFLINHCNPKTTLGIFYNCKDNNKLESITDLLIGILNILSIKEYDQTKYKIINIKFKETIYIISSSDNTNENFKKIFNQGYNTAKNFYINELRNKISELKNNVDKISIIEPINEPIIEPINEPIDQLMDDTIDEQINEFSENSLDE